MGSWLQVDAQDVWVDDSASSLYNTHQRTPANGRWASAEKLLNQPAYNYAQVIGYNEARTPGRGSAIFLHVDKGAGTAGCVSFRPAAAGGHALGARGSRHRHPLTAGTALAGSRANRQSRAMTVRTVAMLTAGGLAPCLSSAVGGLIERYTEVAPDVRLIAYKSGYAGLLTGDSVEVTDEVRRRAHLLHRFGGSPIGNSRVKLTNVKDCVKRGLVQQGQNPLHVAAEQLERDGVDVLHTIGGDDTNGTAADLAAYLHERL